MASNDGLKTVGLTFKADGTVDFRKSLTDVNNAVNENRSAFKLAKSEWDKSTSSADKLRATQEYLQNQTEAYTQKVDRLTEILKAQEDKKRCCSTRSCGLYWPLVLLWQRHTS